MVLLLVLPPVPSQGTEVWLTPPKDSSPPRSTLSADMVVRKTPEGTGSLIRLLARPSCTTVLEPSMGLLTWILSAYALDSALCPVVLPCLVPRPSEPRPGIWMV